MKFIVSLFIAKLPVLACICIAGLLAFKSLHGWGWFLFLACLVGSNLTVNDDKVEGDDT